MHHMAEACARAERRLDYDSQLIDVEKPDTWEGAEHADIHVLHTDVPEFFRVKLTKKWRLIFVPHGTPECVMECTVENHGRPGYGQQDGWASLRHLLKTADATITFWPRHQAFYQSLMPIERRIHCVPMGVDREFWAGGTAHGKYAGTPSVWMSENPHRIKWPLDVLMCWPWVLEQVITARLHNHYVVYPLHRFFIDLANSNGAAYGCYLSAATFAHESLRDIWKDFDFHLSPVRYGDHNTLSMQAAATGLKTISYRGNEYAHYWITEGDQRVMAQELVAIFKGEVEARVPTPVPDLADMGKAMIAIYEAALAAPSPLDARLPVLTSLADSGPPATEGEATEVPLDAPMSIPTMAREMGRTFDPSKLPPSISLVCSRKGFGSSQRKKRIRRDFSMILTVM